MSVVETETRNTQRYCTYCGQPFEAVEGDLNRLCDECKED